MKKNLLILFIISAITVRASDTTRYSISVVDYSLSWTSSVHYSFDDEEVRVVEIDNVNKSEENILVHRQLLGKEKEKIRLYLNLFMTIDLAEEYIERNYAERNQKRINVEYGDEKKSIFISNAYQQDIAGLVSFLNSYIADKNRMKEFINPHKSTSNK